MKLSELCGAAGIYCPPKQENTEISSVTSNSGRVTRGSLFVCLPGTKHDGRRYAAAATAAGAAAVLSEGGIGLVCTDAHRALAFLCRRMYGEGIERLRLVGVTGTNGKTSVAAILNSILKAAGIRCGMAGTLGAVSPVGRLVLPNDERANMTTPDPEVLYPLLSRMARDGAQAAVLEISSHALAKKKVDALSFEVGIFTNLTRDHLDFHITEDAYFEAKRRLFDLCSRAVTNADDPHGALIEGAVTCSASKNADYRAKNIEYYREDGCGYLLISDKYKFAVRSPLAGGFTVMNTLEAAAAAITLGVPPQAVSEGISSLRSVDGRMEKVVLPHGTGFSVYIDYAHTPDALENLLLAARGLSGRKRTVLLFGCGGDRDRGKRRDMALIASRLADFIIVTSDNSRSEEPSKIIGDILRGIDKDKRYTVIQDRREAIAYAVDNALPGDVILLAGKGHEKYEITADGVHPFDEAAIVRSRLGG